MSKRFTKIICVTASAIAALSVVTAAGCSDYYSAGALSGDYSTGSVVSNGGFAVEKGNYVYFINGVEQNTAVNDYGTPEKGAIYRIAKTDLENGNYSSVDCVVPLVAYSSNYSSGIFIHGDYIYYGTPSTKKSSEGAVQNTVLEMKRTKLDGTETMKESYASFKSTAYEYRFVEENDVVYLMYVATSEKLEGSETETTNLHSVNTQTGVDTVLAYDVNAVVFDKQVKDNPRAYYTMDVYDYSTDKDFDYNQLYTVTASATENKLKDKLNADNIDGWDDEKDMYINCGELVLDGVGSVGTSTTVFNKDEEKNELSYKYTPEKFVNGTLFYTRTTTNNSSEYLFSLKENSTVHPVKDNLASEKRILTDGSKADTYEYLFDGNDALTQVIIPESSGISVNKVKDGKLQPSTDLDQSPDYFKIVKDGTATVLSIDTKNNWLYYLLTGGNGYSVNRVDYSGTINDYKPMPAGETDKTPVRFLDIDAVSGWFVPEILDGTLLFASETANMTAYNYIMAFSLVKDGKVMTNGQIRELNEQFEGITEIISDSYGDTDKYPTETYANLQKALNYAYYGGDDEYLKELAEVTNGKVKEGEDWIYSPETFTEYDKFRNPAAEGNTVWADYKATKKVNGADVYANVRDYYYAVIGKMTDKDKEAYAKGLQTTYLVAYPEDEQKSWYEGLSDGEKAGFIVGMVAIGLVVAAGATVLTVWLVKRNKKTAPEIRRKRIKVDTTDDKNVDVYSD